MSYRTGQFQRSLERSRDERMKHMKETISGSLRFWLMYGQSLLGRAFTILQVIAIGSWLANLRGTDADYSVYLLLGGAALLCMHVNDGHWLDIPGNVRWTGAVFAGLFAAGTLLGNYGIFLLMDSGYAVCRDMVCFLGGFFVAANVLLLLYRTFPKETEMRMGVFLLNFCIIAGAYLLYHHCVNYPGTLSPDSFTQLYQIMTGAYTNSHPFYHTMLIKLLFEIGSSITGTENGGAAFFLDVQCLVMAAIFAYTVTTLYQMGLPKTVILGIIAFYTGTPYHINYASCMLKDVLFGGFILLFITALLRIIRNVGKCKVLNHCCLVLGAVGFCLMRTNGWYAFLATAIVFLLLMRKQYPKLLAVMGVVLLICWILLNPVLAILGVEGTDLVEALSVPLQQIAYVVTYYPDILEPQETALLAEAFRMEQFQALYDPYCVDSVKWGVLRRENMEQIKALLPDLAALYLRLGFRCPGAYIRAWALQTKGFWDAGYFLYTGTTVPIGPMKDPRGMLPEDMLEIVQVFPESSFGKLVNRAFLSWFGAVHRAEIFRPLMAIGLAVWTMLSCIFMNIWKKQKEVILCIPVLVIVLGLWIGTPVFAELRYAYPVFTTLPLLLGATLYQPRQQPYRTEMDGMQMLRREVPK